MHILVKHQLIKVTFSTSNYKHNVFKTEEKGFVQCAELQMPVVNKVQLNNKENDTLLPNE